jgi:ABC-type Fe3+-hydroxamate transport system substrate-binding protein
VTRFLLILCAALLLTSCEKPRPSPPPPAGKARVVSLSPAVGVMLRDLRYDQLCVGRDGHDIALSASIPVIGNQNRIDYEALIAANPTHVFTQWGSRDLPQRLVSLAESNHWRLIDSRLLTLDDIRETTTQVDQELCAATGVQAPSEACRELLARMDKAWARGREFSKVGRVLLLAEPSPPAAFGPGSCHYQVLERMGAAPAIATGAAYINLDLEDILRLAPDAIILIKPRAPGSPADQAGKAREATFGSLRKLDIPAVKNKRMALIDDPLGFIPGTSMIRVAEELREVLDAWANDRTPPGS